MNSLIQRQPNCLQWAKVLRTVIAVAFVSACGLSYLYLQHQLYNQGSERRKMEQTLRDLIAQNNVLETQISRLTSHTALQRRLTEGFLKLEPIADRAVVRVRSQPGAVWTVAANDTHSAFQTVAHETNGRP